MFSADDVFRIDHYLGKETVQNLLALRFANTLFEPIWNGHHVDSVQITMAEDVGIGGRAQFYEKTGAARDVLQNHLLQLLALTAMEEPVEFSAEEIRTEKLKVLRAISVPEDLETFAVRGQYEQGWLAGQRANGYRQEEGVAADSTTETYAAVRLGVETRRWAGVPFYLRTGKRLPRRVTEIALVFKRAPHLPFADTDTEELGNNQLVIRVQPDEGVTLKFGSKVPGSVMEVRDVVDGLPLRRAVHRVQPGGLRAAAARRPARRRHAVPAQRRGRGVVGGDRPAGGVLGGHDAAPLPGRRVGARARPTRCWPPRAAGGGDRERRPPPRPTCPSRGQAMTTLWDTTGSAVVKELAAQRRTGGAVLSGVALTLVVVADESRVDRGRGGRDPRRRGAPVPHPRRGAPADRRARAPAGRRGARSAAGSARARRW